MAGPCGIKYLGVTRIIHSENKFKADGLAAMQQKLDMIAIDQWPTLNKEN